MQETAKPYGFAETAVISMSDLKLLQFVPYVLILEPILKSERKTIDFSPKGDYIVLSILPKTRTQIRQKNKIFKLKKFVGFCVDISKKSTYNAVKITVKDFSREGK